MIIGVCGFIGAGKDTVADYLVNVHEFRRDSFASSLKDALCHVFGWDRLMMEGRTKASREWREHVDVWWAERLNIPQLTPRWIMQYWGTEVCRHGFHDDIWIASLENKIRKTNDNVVISDVRFPNEITAIKKAGGQVIRIKRGADPDWYNDAILYNKGPDSSVLWPMTQKRFESLKIHSSETAWIGCDLDQIITNDTSIDDLYHSLNNLL